MKSDVEYKSINCFNELCEEKIFECAAVQLVKENILLVTVYRSPNGDLGLFFDKLCTLLQVTQRMNLHLILNGDFNIHFNKLLHKDTKQFTDVIQSFNLRLGVNTPTRICRIRDKICQNCIDNVITNIDESYIKTYVTDQHLSDHLGLETCIKTNKTKITQFKKIRIFSDKKLLEFKDELNNFDWTFLYNIDDANQSFNSFFEILCNKFNLHFPEKKVKVNNNTKVNWFNDELKLMRNKLDAISVIKQSFETEEITNLYKSLKHDYRKAILNAKQMANTNFIQNSNNKGKATWQLINSQTKNKTKVPSEISAETFNNFFINIPHALLESIPDTEIHFTNFLKNANSPSHSFYLSPTDEHEIDSIIKNLKNTNSVDIYGFNTKTIKFVRDNLVPILTFLFNQCIEQQIFPDVLKLAKVVPIPKNGSMEDINNFRPISVLPIISKIFETLIKNRIVNFFESNNLFDKNQHGYRERKSTISAIVNAVEKILDAIDNNLIPCATFLDLSKAFDCVCHDYLIKKLEFYGIRGNGLKLVTSYLQNRSQAVLLSSGDSSHVSPIKIGVPQGSILGPIFFLIFINDFSLNVPSEIVTLYADDATLVNVGLTTNELATKNNVSINHAISWYDSNKLKTNPEKTQHVIFSPNVEFTKAKFLGIYIDSKLNWQSQIEYLANKLNKTVFQIRKLMELTTLDTAMTFYYSNFYSLITYGILIWGNSVGFDRIFKIQKRAIRTIASVHATEHCRPLFKNLGIMTLYGIFIYQCVLFIKQNNNLTHSSFHNYNTRNKNNPTIPYHRLSKTQQPLNHLAIKLFNKLPDYVKELPVNNLKRYLKQFLIEHPFYTIAEFFNHDFLTS